MRAVIIFFLISISLFCHGQNKTRLIAGIKQSFLKEIDKKEISQLGPLVLTVRSFSKKGFFKRFKIRYTDTITKSGDTAILKKYDYNITGEKVEFLTIKKWVNNMLVFNRQYELKHGQWYAFMVDQFFFTKDGAYEKVERLYNNNLYAEARYIYSFDSTVVESNAEVNQWLPVINIYYKTEALAKSSTLLKDERAIYYKWDLNTFFLYVKQSDRSYDLTVNVQSDKIGFWTQYVQLYNYDIPGVQERQNIVTKRKVKVKSAFVADTDSDILAVLAQETNFLHLPEALDNEVYTLPLK